MSKIIDLDAQFAGEPAEPIHTRKVKLFGEEWTVVCDVNSFVLTNISNGDTKAFMEFLENVVVEEEKARMRQALSSQRGLTAEKLLRIIVALMEVVAARPTQSPSASSRTASKRTSSPKSTAASSRTRGARIAR